MQRRNAAWSDLGPRIRAEYTQARFGEAQKAQFGTQEITVRPEVVSTGALVVIQPITGIVALMEKARFEGGQEDIKDLSLSAVRSETAFQIAETWLKGYLAKSQLDIALALPLSLTGAFGALLLTGQVMSVFTMIGIILLMGIVTKNGILLIDFTMQRIREGKSVKAALLEAGPIRLRPILMTTFAAGGGMLPIAFGHGVGGEARSPMGVAVIGGLLASTLLTLVVVPCFFTVMEDLRLFGSRLSQRFKK
jgi:hypothetical protein